MPGGVEGLIHWHRLIDEAFTRGDLPRSIVILQIDANNCFGNLEWETLGHEIRANVPGLGPLVSWKHSTPSFVEQPGPPPKRKNRGAEQGDPLGPVEAGVATVQLARTVRWGVHAEQREGRLPWCAANAAEAMEATTAHTETHRLATAWENAEPRERNPASLGPHPANKIQHRGGIADGWYLDDGTIVCIPEVAAAYL